MRRLGRGFRVGHSMEGILMLKADGWWPVRGNAAAKRWLSPVRRCGLLFQNALAERVQLVVDSQRYEGDLEGLASGHDHEEFPSWVSYCSGPDASDIEWQRERRKGEYGDAEPALCQRVESGAQPATLKGVTPRDAKGISDHLTEGSADASDNDDYRRVEYSCHGSRICGGPA